MRGTEKSIVRATYPQREPPRKCDDGRRRAHRLSPAVDAPHYREHYEYDRAADASADRCCAKHSHDQVRGGGQDQTGGHKPFDIRAVGQESVDELAHGIGPVKAGADDTKLRGVEQTGVDQRLFHHAHRHTAHIVKSVTECDCDEGLETGSFPNLVSVLRSHLCCGRRTYPEKIEK